MSTKRTTTSVQEFDPARVRPLPGQPRKRFGRIKELAASIKSVGQQTPGLVYLVHDDKRFDAQLIDGERRLRACQTIDAPFRAEVRENPGSADAQFVASFAANFARQDHDVMEIADGVARLSLIGKTHQEIAEITGKSVSWVAAHLNLAKLHPDVQFLLIPAEDEDPDADDDEAPTARRRGALPLQLAQRLSSFPPADQLKLAKKIMDEGLSFAAGRRLLLKRMQKHMTTAEWRDRAGRKTSIATLERMCWQMVHRVGVYLDMPGPQFNHVIAAATETERRTMLKAVDEVVDALTDVAEEVEKSLKKPAARRAS